jgi:hypothetical protein
MSFEGLKLNRFGGVDVYRVARDDKGRKDIRDQTRHKAGKDNHKEPHEAKRDRVSVEVFANTAENTLFVSLRYNLFGVIGR